MKKVVSKNLVTNLVNQVLGFGFPIIIQSYLIRHIALEDIGILNIILSAQSYVILLISFTNLHLLKILSQTDDRAEISSILSNYLALTYAVLVLPMIAWLAYMFVAYEQYRTATLISAAIVLAMPLSVEFYFQAKLKNSFIFYRRLAAKLLFLALMFLFVRDTDDFLWYVVILAFTQALESAVNAVAIRDLFDRSTVHWQTMRSIIRSSVSYIPFQATYNTLPSLGVIFGVYYMPLGELAIFSIIFKIVNLATTFVTSSVMVLFPYKMSMSSGSTGGTFSDANYLWKTILVSFGIIAGLAAGKEIIFRVFLKEYSYPGLSTDYYLLCLFVLIHSVYNYLVFNIYFAENRNWFVNVLNTAILVLYAFLFLLSMSSGLSIPYSAIIIVPMALVTGVMMADIARRKKITVRSAVGKMMGNA